MIAILIVSILLSGCSHEYWAIGKGLKDNGCLRSFDHSNIVFCKDEAPHGWGYPGEYPDDEEGE